MPVRRIKREELLECEKIQSIAFAYPLDTEAFQKELAKEKGSSDPYIGFFSEDNIITACMVLPEYQTYYEGNPVRMVGVGGVASLPEYRHGGAVRQLIRFALRQMLESGTVFSSLYPFSHPYYRKFGYELCQASLEYEIPIETLSKFHYTGKVRMICAGDPIDDLQAIFEAHFSRYNLAVRREKSHWKKIVGENTYQERVYTYLLEDAAGPSAYVVLAAENDGPHDRIGKVREVAFVRPQGLSDVLGFLYRLSAQYSKMYLPLPVDIPLRSLVDESYHIKCEVSNQQMTRVVNVQKALTLKRHFDGASYTLRVHDDGIAENNGLFCVKCENGIVSAVKKSSDDTADLTVDVRTLAQLLLGFLSVDEAIYKPDVQVHANLETLRDVFVKKAVFLTDHF